MVRVLLWLPGVRDCRAVTWSLIVAALVSGAGCGKRLLAGTPGAGDAGMPTGGAGSGGVSSGDPGSGGMSGIGGAPITSCPVSEPVAPIACSGSFGCRFTTFCTCHGCCSSGWRCIDGIFGSSGLDYNDGCIQGPPCPDGGAGTVGTGGGVGVGGRVGTGGVAGSGGAGGGGGTSISSCPASEPRPESSCVGTFTCDYEGGCRCGACCYASYRCMSGRIEFIGSNDGCMVICDGGLGADGPPAPVCTVGADQTCNDNPATSSIHGHCTDAGVCVCGDAGRNRDSGRCF